MSQQALPEDGRITSAPLEVYYMKMTEPQVDARLGKLTPGKVVPVDRAKATRWLTVGIAEQASKGDYEEQQDRRVRKMTARQNAFNSLNDGHALWDVSTYRDVLTAPESGLRMAYERGISLVNVHMLRDEDGDPLPPDADIEEILEARQYLHPDLVAPLAAHDRSSVMGGGSPYSQNVTGGPMPLSPQHREMAERLAEADRFAQIPSALRLDRERDSGQPTGPDGRPAMGSNRAAMRRSRTLYGNQPAGQGGAGQGQPEQSFGSAPPPPPPPVQPHGIPRGGPGISPEAAEQARVYDVPPPRQMAAPQVANAPEDADDDLYDEDDTEDTPPPPAKPRNGNGKKK
jgi:hypothetical protein